MRIALVLGGANCLEADKAQAINLLGDREHLVIACNHAGRDEPGRVDHWCTMHSELFPKWLEDRRAAGRPEPGQLWHAAHRRTTVDSKPIESWGGSSGMLCARLALHLGCERIILAGVPMRKSFEHYDRPGPWHEAVQYHSAWQRRLPALRHTVRSFSGWTADLLGWPTEEWLDG
jgi:hypothetical protein